ncbi:MAG: hypothetical protein R3E09_10695 [Novosphingobium sp.]
MSLGEEIVRVAAKGDGVTASGRHVPGAAPGDVVLADGSLEPGPHHATPPCRHFGKCGSCQLQHLDEEALAGFVADRVTNAATGQGIEPERIATPHLSPQHSRRRATLHAARAGGKVLLGFRESGSHRVADMAECAVLAPELFALIAPLRKLLAAQGGKFSADVELSLVEQGVDVGLKGITVEGLAQTEAMLDFARENALARLTLDQGFGPGRCEAGPATVMLSGVSVPLSAPTFCRRRRMARLLRS